MTKSCHPQKISASHSIPFSKFHGAGNDFILIDDRLNHFDTSDYIFIRELCSRSFGIGADGLILLQKSKLADFKMRIFNADGFEADMCGNGLRCLIAFLKKLQVKKDILSIETLAGLYKASYNQEEIVTFFPKPKKLILNKDLNILGRNRQCHFINTGVEHVVYFVKDKKKEDFLEVAKATRYHEDFKPEGVNVSYVYLEKNTLFLRTYEKGVEGETLACGTAAVAASVISYLKKELKPPYTIIFSSSDKATCDFSFQEDVITNISLSARAHHVFDGTFSKN